jgi:hypothetical protein
MSTEETPTEFGDLSPDAQEYIVGAVMGEFDAAPPASMPESVRAEIARWAESPSPTEPEPAPARHQWNCRRCGERDVPPTHVTYSEHHDGCCGGECVAEPADKEPAPAQTAGEITAQSCGELSCEECNRQRKELADRADRAEALANEWKIEAVESTNALEEAVTACAQIAAERDRLRERVKELEDTERRALFASAISDAHMELKAERDRLREALEDIAKKCGDFNSTPIGPTTITNIAREALNQTTNEK